MTPHLVCLPVETAAKLLDSVSVTDELGSSIADGYSLDGETRR